MVERSLIFVRLRRWVRAVIESGIDVRQVRAVVID
jgi:hypothetical protein